MKKKKIGLDLDGVCCNFVDGVKAKAIEMGINPIWITWHPHWFDEIWPEIENDFDWWLRLNVLDFPEFIPIAYITHRSIPVWVNEEWLKRNDFPKAPVINVEGCKSIICNELGLDIFVDDNPEVHLAVPCSHLYDAEYNRHVNTTKRIRKLNEINNPKSL